MHPNIGFLHVCVCVCVCAYMRDAPPHACEAVHGAHTARQRRGRQLIERGQHGWHPKQHQVLDVEELDKSQRQPTCHMRCREMAVTCGIKKI